MRSAAIASQEGLHLERGHDHRRPAELAGDEQLAVAAGDVEQRDRDERAQVDLARQADDAPGGLGVRQEVRVREHRALREAGRAARVEDRREVVGLGAIGDERVAVGQRRAVLEDVRGARVVEDVLHLGLGEARVHRHDDGARAAARPRTRAPSRRRCPAGSRRGRRRRRPGPCSPPATRAARVPQLAVGQPLAAELDDRLAVAAPGRPSRAASPRATAAGPCSARSRRRHARSRWCRRPWREDSLRPRLGCSHDRDPDAGRPAGHRPAWAAC